MSVKLQKVREGLSQPLWISDPYPKSYNRNIPWNKSKAIHSKSAHSPPKEGIISKVTNTITGHGHLRSYLCFTISNSLMSPHVQTVAVTQSVIPSSYSNDYSVAKSENKSRNYISSILSWDLCLTYRELFYSGIHSLIIQHRSF